MKKPHTKAAKIDIQKLKPKRRRVGRNARSVNHTCPNCLSTIVVNSLGQWECTGNKLKLWSKDFERYKKMNAVEKEEYLNTLDNKDKFLEWYNQNSLHCGWNSQLQKTENTYSVKIPDPIAVNKIERSLGRSLEEDELEEGKFYYRKLVGDKYEYSTEPTEGWHLYVIPRVSFPDDV